MIGKLFQKYEEWKNNRFYDWVSKNCPIEIPWDFISVKQKQILTTHFAGIVFTVDGRQYGVFAHNMQAAFDYFIGYTIVYHDYNWKTPIDIIKEHCMQKGLCISDRRMIHSDKGKIPTVEIHDVA